MVIQKRQGYNIVILEPTKSWIKEDKCGGCGLIKTEWKRSTTYRCCNKECTEIMNSKYVFVGWQQIRDKIFQRDNFTCKICNYKAQNKEVTKEICGRTFVERLHPNAQLDADHIIPISIGGDEWSFENIQTLCKQCHKAKTKKDMKKISAERNVSIDQQRLMGL